MYRVPIRCSRVSSRRDRSSQRQKIEKWSILYRYGSDGSAVMNGIHTWHPHMASTHGIHTCATPWKLRNRGCLAWLILEFEALIGTFVVPSVEQLREGAETRDRRIRSSYWPLR